MSTIEKAKEIATEAHKNQKRWDGEPYIIHPKAVAELVKISYEKENNDNQIVIKNGMIVAYFHDLYEDTNITEEYLKENGFDHSVILDAVRLLTKLSNQSYLDYLKQVVKSNIAVRVKIADLTHNLQGLKKGSMKDKYEIALALLTSDTGLQFLKDK